jgi:hypothetical protein
MLEGVSVAANAQQATGCLDADGYLGWAQDQGYQIVRRLCTSSSAGDWQFLVSKDGERWQLMWQENRWPRPGFERHIEDRVWHGTFEEVAHQLCDLHYQV